MMTEHCELLFGDCLEKLKEIPDNSIDLVLTDPPYGLEFMGKEWDSFKGKIEKTRNSAGGKEDSEGKGNAFSRTRIHIGAGNEYLDFTTMWASTILPKMKSGAFLVFTMTPRQDLLWRCLAGLEKAGFNLNFSSCFWLYHSGFPKSMDLAKQIDKRQGLKGKIVGKSNNGVGNTQNSSYVKNKIQSREEHTGTGVGYLDGSGKEFDLTEPESEQAKQWFGWKSCSLKPAVEIIIVAQKPRTEKTIVEQVLQNGCGAVNVEECRIPYANENDKGDIERFVGCTPFPVEKGWNQNSLVVEKECSASGRFPANLIVSGNPLKGEESKSQGGSGIKTISSLDRTDIGYGFKATNNVSGLGGYGDFGSPNRFYDLDRWAEKRNITLAETLDGDLSAFFDVPKPASSEKEGQEISLDKSPDWKFPASKEDKNFNRHPTVKPILLFSYLAKLFCQPNGTILDPFMGSGTTGIASLKQGFRFVGIEKEKDYFDIAVARIKPQKEQTKLTEPEKEEVKKE